MARAAVAPKAPPAPSGQTPEAPKAPETPKEPETPVAIVKSGRFEFKVQKALPIPEPKKATFTASNPLPFAAIFAGMTTSGDHQFIPNSFWTAPIAEGGRGLAEKSVTYPNTRAKMREAFRKWVDEDKARLDRVLHLVNRKAGDIVRDEDGALPEAGVSMFMEFNPESAKVLRAAQAEVESKRAATIAAKGSKK